MAVGLEDLLNMTNDALMALLEEDQNTGAGTAEAAAKQAWSPELEDLFEAGDQLLPVGLMQAIFQCSGEG